MRAHANNDENAYRLANAGLIARMRRRSKRNNWHPIEAGQSGVYAEAALKWWLWSTCPACLGRKFEQHADDAQVLTGRACEPCSGSGRIPVESIIAPEMLVRVREAIMVIEIAVDQARMQIFRRLQR